MLIVITLPSHFFFLDCYECLLTCLWSGLRERLDDAFKIKKERWKGFNKYVKEFHKRKERIHREKIDRIQREKINLLKINDVEGYLRMVQVCVHFTDVRIASLILIFLYDIFGTHDRMPNQTGLSNFSKRQKNIFKSLDPSYEMQRLWQVGLSMIWMKVEMQVL